MPDLPPDHIGWTLARAAMAWKSEFSAGMVAAGHGWYAQARGNLLQHIGPGGIRQGDLAERASLTKQAVQQFVDELVADGILTRTPDPTDARAKRVVLTEAGRAAMRDADRIKAEIETSWQDRIGPDAFAALNGILRQMILPPEPPGLPKAATDRNKG